MSEPTSTAANREAPQDGIERAREWLSQQGSHRENSRLYDTTVEILAAFAASEVSRVRRETLEVLRANEWSRSLRLDGEIFDGNDRQYCAACTGWKDSGHEPNCWLAAAIRALLDGQARIKELEEGDAKDYFDLLRAKESVERDLAAERAQNEGLREALSKLVNEIHAFAFAAEDIRPMVGNTNWSVFMQRTKEAKALLSAPVAPAQQLADLSEPQRTALFGIPSKDDPFAKTVAPAQAPSAEEKDNDEVERS